MADEIRVNRASSSPTVSPAPSAYAEEPKKGSKLPWIILVVVIVVLAVLGVLFREKLFKAKSGGDTTVQVSGYQAVFLTNGQVYFGKVSNPEGNYVTLKDIFYLQVVQPPLQGQQQDPAAQTQQQSQISLVKLGNELHGPVDEMQINRGQILFYEDLKEDGQVVKAIKDYKVNPAGTAK